MEQGQSDSGSRLADDLLAGLESSEPRQLKWSLKLEPTCREGEGRGLRGRKRGKEGGVGGCAEGASGALLSPSVGDVWTRFIVLLGSVIKVT